MDVSHGSRFVVVDVFRRSRKKLRRLFRARRKRRHRKNPNNNNVVYHFGGEDVSGYIPFPFFSVYLHNSLSGGIIMYIWAVSLSHFLHILGTVVWVGGILMVFLVILPSAKTSLEAAPMVGRLMKEVSQRFTLLANVSIFVLIGTGIILFYHDQNHTLILDPKNIWNILIFLKLLLVATMIIIHFYRSLILNPKIAKASTQVEKTRTTRLKKFSLDLVKTNLALGIIVLMFAAVSISL